ncbi:hypothetical protein T459_02247 [Capsicum annuum]|uniref:Uncharacterized protein n=1 Tax=Capsicum annuum TaxID=4072 RepID=A0A2G3AJE9_CAPAN|nr:hypothetical protein T459_02247 [Capsicum annuum]
MTSAIGVSVPVLRFLLCFVTTIPVSFLHHFVPTAVCRHLYAAITGAVLSYLSFGYSSNLHFFGPMLLGYSSMGLCRRYCGIITYFAAFGYLIGWYISRKSVYGGSKKERKMGVVEREWSEGAVVSLPKVRD